MQKCRKIWGETFWQPCHRLLITRGAFPVCGDNKGHPPQQGRGLANIYKVRLETNNKQLFPCKLQFHPLNPPVWMMLKTCSEPLQILARHQFCRRLLQGTCPWPLFHGWGPPSVESSLWTTKLRTSSPFCQSHRKIQTQAPAFNPYTTPSLLCIWGTAIETLTFVKWYWMVLARQ